MAVYVDTMKAAYGRMIMCHMIADSSDELFNMVKQIGVNPKWVQYQGTYKEHFDISLAKKKLAIEAGAIEISQKELGKRLREKRNGN